MKSFLRWSCRSSCTVKAGTLRSFLYQRPLHSTEEKTEIDRHFFEHRASSLQNDPDDAVNIILSDRVANSLNNIETQIIKQATIERPQLKSILKSHRRQFTVSEMQKKFQIDPQHFNAEKMQYFVSLLKENRLHFSLLYVKLAARYFTRKKLFSAALISYSLVDRKELKNEALIAHILMNVSSDFPDGIAHSFGILRKYVFIGLKVPLYAISDLHTKVAALPDTDTRKSKFEQILVRILISKRFNPKIFCPENGVYDLSGFVDNTELLKFCLKLAFIIERNRILQYTESKLYNRDELELVLKTRSSSIIILFSENRSSVLSSELATNLHELQDYAFSEFGITLLDGIQERVFYDMAKKAIVFNKEVQTLYSSSMKTREVIKKHLYGSGKNGAVHRPLLTSTYYVEAKDISSWILRTYPFKDFDSSRLKAYENDVVMKKDTTTLKDVLVKFENCHLKRMISLSRDKSKSGNIANAMGLIARMQRKTLFKGRPTPPGGTSILQDTAGIIQDT